MKKILTAFALILSGFSPAMAEIFETSAGTVEVTRIAGPFEHPWSLAFLPAGQMLVTERPGRLNLVSETGVITPFASGVPEVRELGQGGLLDVAVAPNFDQTQDVYLTYTQPDEFSSGRTALARAKLRLDRSAGQDGSADPKPALEDLKTIFQMSGSSRSGAHFGSRIVFAEDGETLWITIGDRGARKRAQDLSVHNGKVLRLNRDGSIPKDNPFVGREDAQPEIWSYGHRNPQGATLRGDGKLITVSHGARGGDEVNVSRVGANFGWPVISYGRHYSGLKIGEGALKEGMEQPLWYWDPSIAPSGATFLNSALFDGWQGSLLVGALRGQAIARLAADGDGYKEVERLFEGAFGRIRDVREGPDGAIWFLTDDSDGALYRAKPAE